VNPMDRPTPPSPFGGFKGGRGVSRDDGLPGIGADYGGEGVQISHLGSAGEGELVQIVVLTMLELLGIFTAGLQHPVESVHAPGEAATREPTSRTRRARTVMPCSAAPRFLALAIGYFGPIATLPPGDSTGRQQCTGDQYTSTPYWHGWKSDG